MGTIKVINVSSEVVSFTVAALHLYIGVLR